MNLGVGNLEAWKVGQSQHAWYFITVGVVLVAMMFASIWRQQAMNRFADAGRWRHLVTASRPWARYVTRGCLVLALVLMVFALLDIRLGKGSREVPQRGIEVVFALDVSRSMLAEDIQPNRLSRAKHMINDTLDAMAGDAAGLVIFAGDAKQVIPVTNHRDEFRERLASVSPDDLMRGGSRLGDAIRVARDAFLTTSSDSRVIVMLTDGEDMESEPVKAARQAQENEKITIFTIGLGDSAKGARVPTQSLGKRGRRPSPFAKYEGNEIWSKLDGGILSEIATSSGGVYIPAGTKQVNMEEFYHGYLDRLPDSILQTRAIDQYKARYQWFLLPAVLLLLIAGLLGRPV